MEMEVVDFPEEDKIQYKPKETILPLLKTYSCSDHVVETLQPPLYVLQHWEVYVSNISVDPLDISLMLLPCLMCIMQDYNISQTKERSRVY